MFSQVCLHRRFSPRWQYCLFAFLSIALFVCLGIWQVQRAQEKKMMIARGASLGVQKPLCWLPGMANPVQYQPVIVDGDYLPEVILLDNQHHQHQFGYHVLSPLQVSKDAVVLIDRGWQQGDPARQHFPTVERPARLIRVSGQVYFPSSKEWVLGQVLEKKNARLAIAEKIDPELISQFLHKSVYPFIIRLNKTEPYGFTREWALVSMPPERHYAYALQWFAMALVIFVIFVGLNTKKINEKSET